jgi:hypothetical protein
MQRLLVVVVALCLLAPSGGAQSASSYVNSALASDVASNSNYMHMYTSTGLLPAGGSLTVQVYLHSGYTYRVRGSCDVDCRDVDLRISEPGGSGTMASDVLMDDFPVLNFVAPRSGYAAVTVSMPSCSTAWCTYGFVVLRR